MISFFDKAIALSVTGTPISADIQNQQQMLAATDQLCQAELYTALDLIDHFRNELITEKFNHELKKAFDLSKFISHKIKIIDALKACVNIDNIDSKPFHEFHQFRNIYVNMQADKKTLLAPYPSRLQFLHPCFGLAKTFITNMDKHILILPKAVAKLSSPII
jgi:hypothetical protein